MSGKIYQLKQLAMERYGQKSYDMRFTKVLRARLNHELEIIEKTQTEDYFLSFIKQGDEAKKKGEYYVNGIANCSFLLYCTNTTAVNPLAFGLPFERFINPLRINGPYFEILFTPKRILTEEERNTEIEKRLIKSAIENEQLSADALDQKYAYPTNNYPLVEDVLKPTNHVLIWQEQLLELLYRVGGFSYGEADIIRRKLAKKQMREIYEEVLPKYLEHAVQAGYDDKWADGFFHYMIARSSYLPCKAFYAAITLHISE